MVGAWKPERVATFHALPTGEGIHKGLVKGMPHVQGARDIRRRQLNAKAGRVLRLTGFEKALLLPLFAPVGLEGLGVKGLVKAWLAGGCVGH